jgi:uncharacterized protein involved in response to NO
MILAVMTRASLGHTGRTLIATRPMTLCYVLILIAAVVRVFAPAAFPSHYEAIVTISALLWVGAFGLFIQIFAPILCRPRADGRPG